MEPKPGANGSIAAQQVAKSKPDGLTLFFTTNTTHAANPSLMKQMTYDPVKDFAPVSLMARQPFLLAVGPKVGARTLADYVAAVGWAQAYARMKANQHFGKIIVQLA